jgi:hypothetical protein
MVHSPLLNHVTITAMNNDILYLLRGDSHASH